MHFATTMAKHNKLDIGWQCAEDYTSNPIPTSSLSFLLSTQSCFQ